MDKIDIDLCICTFRRQHIADTLHSVAQLTLKPEWNFRIVVADNDTTPTAKALVEQVAASRGLTVTYVHAPACNISIARNACLDAANAPYVAFIDDDELVTKDWLVALMDLLESSGAEIAVGPVKALYGPSAPEWIKRGDFHSMYPVLVDGQIKTAASNNVLMRHSAPMFKGLRFRTDLGRTGGEDTIFFASACDAGARIVYAQDAVVTEDVPATRATLRWLIKRRFRYGQTHGSLVLTQSSGLAGRVKNIALSGSKFAVCIAGAIANLFRPDKLLFWTLRGTLHAGAVVRLLGKREVECYG